MVRFTDNTKTSEVIKGYVSEGAYRKFVNMMATAGPADVVKDTVDTFRLGDWIGIPDGTSAVVVKSERFTKDPTHGTAVWDGICVRVLEGSCHEISGDPSSELIGTVDSDCSGRVLWVNSVFVQPMDSISVDELIRSFRAKSVMGFDGNNRPTPVLEFESPYSIHPFTITGTYGGWDKCCEAILTGSKGQVSPTFGTDIYGVSYVVVDLGLEGKTHDEVYATKRGSQVSFDCRSAESQHTSQNEVWLEGCTLATAPNDLREGSQAQY